MLEKYMSFFKVHERLLLLLVLLGVALFGLNKYYDYESQKANARNQTTQAVLAAQKESDAKQALVVAAVKEHDALIQKTMSVQNARLSGEILQLSQSLAARQKQDAALPLP